MKAENKRALVDEINKKTIEGKLHWAMVPDLRGDFRHPDASVDYYYCANLGGKSLYLYDTTQPKEKGFLAGSQLLRMMNFTPDCFLVVRDEEGADQLVLNGVRLLNDLMATVASKAGSPDSVAQDIVSMLRDL